MNILSRTSVRRAVCAVVSLSILLQPVVAGAAQMNLVKTPLFVTPPIPPLVMLDISKDQQLHKKAYNDYSDLDNDGKLETTYKHSIDYYGYFDSYKCYDYVNAANTALEAGGRFVPAAWTADKYCSGKWSGNFLNWSTMTRMDAVRRLLFGGLRRVDKDPGASGWSYGSTTVLERSYLPTDAHSFAKYYGGDDLVKLTPFNLALDPVETGDIATGSVTTAAVTVVVQASRAVQFTNIPAAFADGFSPGDQIRATARDVRDQVTSARCIINGRLVNKTTGATPTMTLWVDVGGTFVDIDYSTDPPTTGPVTTGAPPALNCNLADNTTTATRWRFQNLSSTGITICNMTPGATTGVNQFSQTNTNTPRLRIIKGNHELWASNERRQCAWHDEFSNLQGNTLPA